MRNTDQRMRTRLQELALHWPTDQFLCAACLQALTRGLFADVTIFPGPAAPEGGNALTYAMNGPDTAMNLIGGGGGARFGRPGDGCAREMHGVLRAIARE